MVHQGLNARRRAIVIATLAALGGCALPGTGPGDVPPPAPRELRAAWVASVAHIDWPSRTGLSPAEQQRELRAIVERAASLKLNALIVQVRPAADALYPSALEPWSEYLTGAQGRPPEPFWDPLAMWIEESHRRGIELHAWFNPYRARHSSARSPEAPSHVARAAPGVVRAYGEFLWMDPAEPEAVRRTLAVIADVVRRYDVDGVHIDDYFYPYPVKPPGAASDAPDVEFPDDERWGAYLSSGGTLGRADWRRRHVDSLVEAIHAAVRREKPWVRFGVSPFGIGRPDRRPAGVAGFSQYDRLFADVEAWVANGWLDYLSPQLYWKVESPGQPFEPLLDYWPQGNAHARHIWPGFFTSRIDDTPRSWAPEDITRQVAIARTRGTIGGHVHFSMAALMQDRKGIAERLARVEYARPALVPATPWLGSRPPAAPQCSWHPAGGARELRFAPAPDAWIHAIWTRHGGEWRFAPLPAAVGRMRIEGAEAIVVSTVNRLGIESARVAVDPRP